MNDAAVEKNDSDEGQPLHHAGAGDAGVVDTGRRRLTQAQFESALLVIIGLAWAALLILVSWIAAANRAPPTAVTDKFAAALTAAVPGEPDQASALLDLAVRADAANARIQRRHTSSLIGALVAVCMILVGGLLATLILNRLGPPQLEKLPAVIWAPLTLSILGAIVLCTVIIAEATSGAEVTSRDILQMLR